MITGDLKKMLLYAGSLVIQSMYLVNELMFSCCALKIREGKVVIVTPTTPGRCYTQRYRSVLTGLVLNSILSDTGDF